MFLRRAVALSEAAVAGGRSAPSYAMATARSYRKQGQLRPLIPRDWTTHPEMQALRAASAAMTWEALGSATIYASADPCPVCAAAIYWCNIRRLVFCVNEPTMRALREPYERAAGIAMRCDEIFDRCSRLIEVLGPLPEEVVSKVHQLFWPNARADV